MGELKRIERALISVSDKAGIVDFARALADMGVMLISTGGTARTLRGAGMNVTDVSEITGFPEMMDGRVKTLHPKVHGGLLALRDDEDHMAAMRDHGIEPIDMVVVDLYPFERTVAEPDVALEDAVENIDIGGPAMIRSASKNWRDVAVVTDTRLYGDVIAEMRGSNGSLALTTRQRLAALAFTRTASYDLAISSYLARQLDNDDLERLEPLNPLAGLAFIQSEDEQDEHLSLHDDALPTYQLIELAKVADLRYGENPHQLAAVYRDEYGGGIVDAEQLQGKEMSFNNYVDADAAWALVNDIEELAVAIIKHTNPSGVGLGSTVDEAYKRALSTDPVSAFGGIVACNRPIAGTAARSITEIFTEVIIAPAYDSEAVEVFRAKKNLRVLKCRPGAALRRSYKHVHGGMLVQTPDEQPFEPNTLRVVTRRHPSEQEMNALRTASLVCKHVKSNAIVLADEYRTVGVGAGQMNRVDSLRIAAMRAERFGLPLKGCALASDAFFPFRDTVDEAAELGISAIIQPGGSVKDSDSIAAADEHEIAMVFTGVRHFRH
jgi:phosphoribosylaminoimidazolecarboxamide formyltransferase / IMP cyclohydrolase